MHRFIRILLTFSLLAMLSACATVHMTEVPDAERVTRPAPGKALVYFTRATSFGGAIQAPLYDGDDFIGIVSANTHLAYQAEPGKHMFMVIGESADFMSADLLPGKTYYARVQPRMGVWKARFSFGPHNGEFSEAEEAVRSTRQVQLNDSGRKWALDNAASVAAKKAEYLPKWNAKTEKQILLPSSGR